MSATCRAGNGAWKRHVFKELRKAEQVAGAKLTLGVCPRRCSPLGNLDPTCEGWTGKARASTKRCFQCGSALRRVSRWCWVGAVRVQELHR